MQYGGGGGVNVWARASHERVQIKCPDNRAASIGRDHWRSAGITKHRACLRSRSAGEQTIREDESPQRLTYLAKIDGRSQRRRRCEEAIGRLGIPNCYRLHVAIRRGIEFSHVVAIYQVDLSILAANHNQV